MAPCCQLGYYMIDIFIFTLNLNRPCLLGIFTCSLDPGPFSPCPFREQTSLGAVVVDSYAAIHQLELIQFWRILGEQHHSLGLKSCACVQIYTARTIIFPQVCESNLQSSSHFTDQRQNAFSFRVWRVWFSRRLKLCLTNNGKNSGQKTRRNQTDSWNSIR